MAASDRERAFLAAEGVGRDMARYSFSSVISPCRLTSPLLFFSMDAIASLTRAFKAFSSFILKLASFEVILGAIKVIWEEVETG